MQQSSLILMQNFKNSCNFYITLAFYLTYNIYFNNVYTIRGHGKEKFSLSLWTLMKFLHQLVISSF